MLGMNAHKARLFFNRITRPATLGIFRRTSPLSEVWGYDRGTPVDRYYIEKFLLEYQQDIAGRILEVKDSEYTRRYGTAITQTDILDIDKTNKNATIIADLSTGEGLPSMAFDCFILTHTLQYVFNVRAAIDNAYRLLRPGGVLLVAVPSVCRIDTSCGGDYWRFTAASCARLFSESFGLENTTVRSYGNVLVCIASLMGMAFEELSAEELTKNDDAFPLIIAVRAVKSM